MVALLAVDVGNSNIKFGIHDGQRWTHQWPVSTVRDKTSAEYAAVLRSFLKEAGIEPKSVPRAVLSSVVPQLTEGLCEMLAELTGRSPLQVTAALDLGVSVTTDNPAAVGADLLANAVAGYERFGTACIVVSFGTATTILAVSDHGALRGVAIAAGLEVTANALVGGAAQLAHIPLIPPPTALGRTTTHAMQAGLVLGHLVMVEGLIARITEEDGPHQVVATGGLATTLAKHSDVFDAVDPLLTLEGLRLIAERNPFPGST